MGTRQVELALALEPAWPWLALVATHAGTGAWPMAARTCVWQGATGAAWTTWLWH